MLTHTPTHWCKSQYGFSGLNSSQDLILLGQKCHESTAQQAFDHPLAVGKDEVGSSNLPSSSIETLEPQRFEGFNLFLEFVEKTLFPTILPTNLLSGIVKSFVFVTWQ